MSSTSIELTWSNSDGAVDYRLYRVPRASDSKPDLEAMTADRVIHTASEAGRFVDNGVEGGTRYWFGIRTLDAEGALVASGWHGADAVDDTEPPSLVPDLVAVVDDGEVLVTWSEPDENYELHGYRILRSVDGEEPTSLATTWRTEQTSFVDDQLPLGGAEVTYGIVAFDFHWNDSAPAEVSVELP